MNQAEVLHNQLLGNTLVNNLTKRGIAAYYCATKEDALIKALDLIPETDIVSWGGSISIKQIGLLDAIKKRNPFIDRDLADSLEDKMSLMRKALLCDTFLMSCNAVSKDGQLVNIDRTGNRLAAMIFGPKQVVMIVGINKVAGTLAGAIDRASNVAAPINAARFPHISTPCSKLGICTNCISQDSICCQLVITRTSLIKWRIKVVLVGESLGF